MQQIKNSFDAITKSKIFKSFLLTLVGIITYAVINLLQWLMTQDFGNQNINSLISLLVPFIINSIKEYKKGV